MPAFASLKTFFSFFRKAEKSQETNRKKYSDILIVEELDRYFSIKKPYLNPDYKISDLEKQLKVNRSAISSFTKNKFNADFNQFLNLWRIAELQRLQSLIENEDVNIEILCKKAGFRNVQQYRQAERIRKAKKKKKRQSPQTIKKQENEQVVDVNKKKKPDIQIKV